MFESVTLRAVREEHQRLTALVDGLDPADTPAREAVELYTAFDQIVRTATAARTLLAARTVDAQEWKRKGFRNPEDHLAATSGSSIGDAKRELSTSKQLQHRPKTRKGMVEGSLSPDQGQAIADAADANPDAEDDLIAAAGRENLNELRERARRAKAAADEDPAATHRRIDAERRCTRFTDGEGAWNLTARGTPDKGAVVNATLDPIIDELFHAARAKGLRVGRDTYAFDALVEMARRASGTSVGQPASDGDTALGRSKATNPRFLALLRVDVEALIRGMVAGDEVCEISGVGTVPVSVARDLLGESILKLVITRGVDVLNVTSLGRGPTAAMKIALAWSQPTCMVEGCSRTITEYDHTEEWAKTHHTRLDELQRFCTGHHDLKSLEGWELVVGTGKRPMVPPDDPRHPKHPDRARAGPAPPRASSPAGARAPTAPSPGVDQPDLFGNPAA